jgi:peroxiredoxin
MPRTVADMRALLREIPRYTKTERWRSEVKVKVGMAAPDFELKSHAGDTIRLSEYRGRHHVLVAFFPLAWTPV